jgi:hypothetical protein
MKNIRTGEEVLRGRSSSKNVTLSTEDCDNMILLGMFLIAGGAFMGSYTAVEKVLKYIGRKAYMAGYRDACNGVPYPRKNK